MGLLLILAYGEALYTSKHSIDNWDNVGSIPTGPTKLTNWNKQMTQKIFMVIGNAGDGTNFIQMIKSQKALDLVQNRADEGDERYASGDGLQVRELKFPDEFALDTWVAENFYGGYSDEELIEESNEE